MSHLHLTLGNQLFNPELVKKHLHEHKKINVFMREDKELCSYYQFHKQKIIFFLAAMRTYADELSKNRLHVHYEKIEDTFKSKLTFEQSLQKFLTENKTISASVYEIEDKFFEKRLIALFAKVKINLQIIQSPMFLTSRDQFKKYLSPSKRPFMKVFYEKQRVALKILIEKDLSPIGGQWSFDAENRQPLPNKINPPDVARIKPSQHVKDVCLQTDKLFSDHVGKSEQFWLPVSRKEAHTWLDQFTQERLTQFGPYEDAIPEHSTFVFHSVLTPFLNVGLLTPDEIVHAVLTHYKKAKVPIASVEGFIRQVIGWREFIRGIYQNFSDKQETTNYFKHTKKLKPCWYDGTTGITPLDTTIKKTVQFGYAHHIERLMVVGSLMLLLEIEPAEAHKWFMEMFIDSSDWVMGPNVYGMALFSDGGIFATKPYFCGSNYYKKMGLYKIDAASQKQWADGVDGLYWGFIEKHKDFFLKNPRMSMMARTVEKMETAKKKRIYTAAAELKRKLTQ